MSRQWRRLVVALVALPILAFPGRGVAYRLTAAEEPESGPVKIGTRYKYGAYLHCGITDLRLGDSVFEADNPVTDPAPWWWWGFTSGYHRGSAKQTSADKAVFTGTNGLSVRFTRINVPADGSYPACE